VILPLLGLVALAGYGAVVGWWAGGSAVPSRRDLDPTTPLRATIAAYLVLYVIGSVVILVAGESAGPGPLLAGVALASLAVGAVVATSRLGLAPPMAPARAESVSVAGIAVLAIVGLAAVGFLVSRHGIPLLSADPQASRAGFAGLIFDVFRWLVPPAALSAFALALASGQARHWAVAAAALVGVAGLEVLLASRALPFELGVAALLIAFWAGRLPSIRGWIGLAAVGLVIFVGVLLLRVGPERGFSGPADAATFAVRRTIDRVLLIHPRTLEVVASTIPADEPFFAGSTYLRRLAPALGIEERPSLGYWIYERLFPDQPGGFAAPGVAAEAWANGGPPLAIALMAALGALAVWLGRAIGRLPGGPADRAFAAVVVVAVARTHATSLNGFLMTLAVAAGWWLVATGAWRRRQATLSD
jgi:hypothetical protein